MIEDIGLILFGSMMGAPMLKFCAIYCAIINAKIGKLYNKNNKCGSIFVRLDRTIWFLFNIEIIAE